MLSLLLLTIVGPLVGAVAGLLAAWWFLFRQVSDDDAAHPSQQPDPFVSAQIDRAAVDWAQHQGRPEAAGLMADKLHLLYTLGRRRQL